MRERSLLVGLVAVLALATTGCKLKLEATPKGFKPGTSDVIVLHVVSEKDADIFCEWCMGKITKVPDSGEVDVEIQIPSTATTKKLTLKGRKGSRKEGEVVIDLEKSLPPNFVVNDWGQMTCEPRKCGGGVEIIPEAKFTMYDVPAGTIAEVGSEKFTAPNDGSGHVYVAGPLKNVALSPPLQKWALMDVCTGKREDPRPLVSTPVKLTFPDGVSVSGTAAFKREAVQRDLTRMLNDISKGPVLFPWEKAGTPATGKRAAIYMSGGVCYDAGQPGATIADLDVVAVSRSQERTEECKDKLTGSQTGKTYNVTFKLTMRDENATAYDRVTGKILGTKLFQAPRSCRADSKFINSASTDVKGDDRTTSVDSEEIGRWAATFAK